MNHTKCYIPHYPRPRFVRQGFSLLNGEWGFVKDYQNIGERQRYYSRFPADSGSIVVPFSYTSESSCVQDKTKCDVLWYSRAVNVTVSKGQRAILHFDGADYYTKVWVNGAFVGESRGGYHRSSFDITDFIKNGIANVVVRVEDSYSAEQPRGKQKWLDNRFGCWYTETSGIFKSVWLEVVNECHLKSVDFSPNISNRMVCVNYCVQGDISGLTLSTRILFKGKLIASGSIVPVHNSFSAAFDITTDSDPFKIAVWSEHSPNLYDVEIELSRGGKVVDSVGSYFGVREFAAVGNTLTVNSWGLYLKMILDQGYFLGGGLTPTEEQLLEDVQLVKRMGFNGIRKHQKIEDELFYYYCDIMGVYVWLEMPSAYVFSPDMVQAFTAEWMQVLRQFGGYSCVMACVPFNESWGVGQIYSDARQQEFTRGVYHLTKSMWKGLVISNDGWEHSNADIVTLHNYEQNGALLGAALNNMDAVLANRYKSARPAFSLGSEYSGQPIVLSEFGGIAFEKDKGGDKWGYGQSVSSEQEFFDRFKSQLDAIYNCPQITGFCYTQLTDIEQEVNGLLTMERRPKVELDTLKKLINRF